LRCRDGGEREVAARVLVNTAGPWVLDVLARVGLVAKARLRLVKGSHIVVPRLYEGEHAFILQNDDRRVVFMIPYHENYTLIGTTDVPLEHEAESAQPSFEEVDYLCRAAGRYLATAPRPSDVVWRYAGVRPLYDDGSPDASSVTRDYTLRVDDEAGGAPVLSVFGGKLTTYRGLAEHAMQKLAPYFAAMKGPWTSRAPLPGSEFEDRERAQSEFFLRYRGAPSEVLRGVFRRHGSRAAEVLGDGDFGEHYGAGLTERELRYFVQHEWARTPEDVLWRRTKAGLAMNDTQRARVAAAMAR